MLYYLFDYLDQQFDLIGAGVFQYISFRAGAAAFLSLLITITFGKRLINFLRRKQVGEDIRDLGLQGQVEKP
jgi:phospho-N-acetylmuramoyl-pentapeptide-transferase